MPNINITKTISILDSNVNVTSITANAVQGANTYPLNATYTHPNLTLTSSGSIGDTGNFTFNVIINFNYFDISCSKSVSFVEYITNLVDLNTLYWAPTANPLSGEPFIDNNTAAAYWGTGTVSYNPSIHSLADSIVGGWASFNGIYGFHIRKKSTAELFLKLPGDGVIEFESSCPVGADTLLSGHMFYMIEHRGTLADNYGKKGLIVGVGVHGNSGGPGCYTAGIYLVRQIRIGYGEFVGSLFNGYPRTWVPRFYNDYNCDNFIYKVSQYDVPAMYPDYWSFCSIKKRIYRFEFIGNKIKAYMDNVYLGEMTYINTSSYEFGFILEGSTYYGNRPTYQYRFIRIEGSFNA